MHAGMSREQWIKTDFAMKTPEYMNKSNKICEQGNM